MNKTLLTPEKINEVLGRANYWHEVNSRDSNGSTNIGEVLASELHEVVRSLGFSILWILEEYAKAAAPPAKEAASN